MNQIKWNGKRLSASALAVLMAAGAVPSAALAADVSVTADDSASYKYVYAGMSWADYWKSEGVYLSGTDWEASSDVADARGELDKGAFDAVTRATTNHGLHRGSFQCNAVIYGTNGGAYAISHWTTVETGETKDDGSAATEVRAILLDGRQAKLSKDDAGNTNIVVYAEDGTTSTEGYNGYKVLGDKYVPVAVKAEDYDAFCKEYNVTENGAAVNGGYSEKNLNAYEAVAAVTENTNGLKYAEKQADGTFVFSARAQGTDSGLAETAQQSVNLVDASAYDASTAGANDVYAEVQDASKAEAYGCFVRLDLKGNYGGLGSKMYAVRWDYYGDKNAEGSPIASYGTKFAADNWMHSSQSIQLGLTDSLRCQLPEGTDGTGNWVVTIYAMGYQDTVVPITVNADNISTSGSEDVNTEALVAAIAKAEALNEADYTAESWAAMQTELQEAKDELATPHTQATVDEAVAHLTAAIDALEAALAAPEVTAKSKSYNSIALSWNDVGADTYQVYRATKKDGSYKKIAEGNTTSYVNKGVTTGKNYYYKVVALNGENSKESAVVKASAKLSATKISKATNVKGKKVSLKWSKVSGANGYVISRAQGNGSYKTIKTIKSGKTVSYTNTSLKKGSKYSYKIRAYRTVSGKRVYSAYSAVKTVKVSK